MAALICIGLPGTNFWKHVKNGFTVFFEHQNMGLDTLTEPLSVILTELLLTIQFSLMAPQICILMARGTFCQLVNIADRFLRFF